jgi:hypothetical protein
MPARGSGTSKSRDTEAIEVPTPGEWVQVAPGHYQWREGTMADLHEEHEARTISRHAAGLTTEHGTWVFTGVPAMPEGGFEAAKNEDVEDLDRRIADLQTRRTRAVEAQQA